MFTQGAGLLQHADRQIGGFTGQPDRAGKAGRAATDDQDVELYRFGIGRLGANKRRR